MGIRDGFKKVGKFLEDHEREFWMADLGLIGAIAGYFLTEPSVQEKVEDWAIDKTKKLISNVHVTFGDPGRNSVSIGASNEKSGRPLTYYDYLDRREQRQHEEHMAEIKMRNHIFDNGESKVE